MSASEHRLGGPNRRDPNVLGMGWIAVWIGFLRAAFVFWMATALPFTARSHDPGVSTAQGQLKPGRIEVVTGFAPADVRHFLPSDTHVSDQWDDADFEEVWEHLERVAERLWEASVDGVALRQDAAGVQLLPGDNVSFNVILVMPAEGGRLTLRAPKLAELPLAHRQFVLLFDQDGSTVAKKLLSPKDSVLEVSLPWAGESPQSAAESVTPNRLRDWGILKRGVGHAWSGFKSLFFLLAVLLVCRSFRSGVVIVTCFMMAHSITLALASFQWASLPTGLVEVLIAASIVCICCENLWHAGSEPPGRWAVTFTFGLAHGFGFASVLREFGVDGLGGDVVRPLLAFNLGLGTGQVVTAAIALPIIWELQKQKEFGRRWMPILSALLGGAGLYWLLARTLLA